MTSRSDKGTEKWNLSRYLTNLMHKICFTVSFISCLYMFRAHVLIIRRSKLHYTASGIITPIGVMIPDDSLQRGLIRPRWRGVAVPVL